MFNNKIYFNVEKEVILNNFNIMINEFYLIFQLKLNFIFREIPKGWYFLNYP